MEINSFFPVNHPHHMLSRLTEEGDEYTEGGTCCGHFNLVKEHTMESTRDIATQTISRILGDAAFIFTDTLAADARPSPDIWDAEGVSLKFIGQPSGEVRMWVGSAFACIVAANMLGIETGGDEAQRKGIDALKELLNIIVGNFMTAAYGETPVFVLGLPEQLPREQLAKNFHDAAAVWLEAEGNPVMFLVNIVP